jgi:hypothetical protein
MQRLKALRDACQAKLDQDWAGMRQLEPDLHRIALRGLTSQRDLMIAQLVCTIASAELRFRETDGMMPF